MPLGAARLALLAKSQVTAVAEVIRYKVGVSASGNAQVDTAQYKFGGSSCLSTGSADSLLFDGSLIPLSGDFTIESWVRFTGTNSRKMLYSQYTSGTGRTSLEIELNEKASFFCASQSSFQEADRILSDSALSVDTWYHIAVVRNGSTFTMYIDGVAQADTISHSVNIQDQDFEIFGDDFGTHTDDVWQDEFRISNTARYTTGFTPATAPFTNDDDTLLLLHMNGTDGSTFFEDDNGTGRSAVGVFTRGVDIATADSKFGGASMFVNNNNSTDHVEIDDASNTQFRLGSTFTIEGWFKPQLSGDRFWCFKGVNTSGGFGLAVSNSLIRFRHAGTTDLTYSRSDSNWQHIAFVSDGTNKQIYYNGSLVATTTASLNITDTNNLSIGNELTNSTFGYYGYIDEVRISDTARYTTGFTPSTTPFVNDDNTLLLLHMNGTDGSTFFEDDNGTSRSAVGVSALGNAQIDTAQSKFGGASALFDGTGDYLKGGLNAPDTYKWATHTDFTVECWIRINDLNSMSTTSGTIIPYLVGNNSPSAVTNYWTFGPTYNGYLKLYYYTGTTRGIASTTGSHFSTGTWYHIAMVKESTTVTFYIDGTDVGSGTIIGTPQYSDSLGLTFGQYNSNSISAAIDEFRISDTARYTTGFTPSTTPFQNDDNTLLLLHMNGTDGSTVFRDDNGTTP